MMKEHGIKAKGKKTLVVTTDSKNNLPIASLLSTSTYASTLQVVP